MIFDSFFHKRTVRKANRTTRNIYKSWLNKTVTVRVGGETIIHDTLIGYTVEGDHLTLNFAGGSNVISVAGGQPPTHIWCDDVRAAA